MEVYRTKRPWNETLSRMTPLRTAEVKFPLGLSGGLRRNCKKYSVMLERHGAPLWQSHLIPWVRLVAILPWSLVLSSSGFSLRLWLLVLCCVEVRPDVAAALVSFLLRRIALVSSCLWSYSLLSRAL